MSSNPLPCSSTTKRAVPRYPLHHFVSDINKQIGSQNSAPMLRKCRQIGLEPVDDAVLLIIGNVGNERRLFNHAPHAMRSRVNFGNARSLVRLRARLPSVRSLRATTNPPFPVASDRCPSDRRIAPAGAVRRVGQFADDKRRRTRERHLRTCCRPSHSGDRLPRCWSLVSRIHSTARDALRRSHSSRRRDRARRGVKSEISEVRIAADNRLDACARMPLKSSAINKPSSKESVGETAIRPTRTE